VTIRVFLDKVAMPRITERLEENLTIAESTSLAGMVVGNVTVANGANLQLHGMVIGQLILEPGSETFVHGMVNGDVVNRGGYLFVFGTINGRIIEQGGHTKIDAKAIVRGK
jgi:hypothetical protein